MQSKSDKLKKIPHILVRALASLMPRKKHLIVYGGAMDCFIDNVKYLFIYHNLNMQGYKHVWLTKSDATFRHVRQLGFEVCRSDSMKGKMLQLRAGYYIVDDNIQHFANHHLSAGATRINLWHGIPFKMIGWIKTDDDPPYQPKGWLWERLFAEHLHGDYLLSTSTSMSTQFSAALLFPIEKVYIGGYPRTLPFFSDEKVREEHIERFESDQWKAVYREIKNRGGKKMIYMPTFRDKNPDYMSEAIPDWEQLNEALLKGHATLYVKVHRMTPLPRHSNTFSNIVIMDGTLDVYPMLPLFDALLSDTSSIVGDFALLHRPIYLYTFDLQQYISQSRPVLKRFWQMHDRLVKVPTFSHLLQLLSASEWPESLLPPDDYFDCPQDMDASSRLIERLTSGR